MCVCSKKLCYCPEVIFYKQSKKKQDTHIYEDFCQWFHDAATEIFHNKTTFPRYWTTRNFKKRITNRKIRFKTILIPLCSFGLSFVLSIENFQNTKYFWKKNLAFFLIKIFFVSFLFTVTLFSLLHPYYFQILQT